jgi:hypothetical protein
MPNYFLIKKMLISWRRTKKYDKQDRQGKAAFNERSPHPTQQQAARSPGGPQRKTGQGTRQSTGRQTTASEYIISNLDNK